MKKQKELTVKQSFLLLGGTVISWFMYTLGKVNGLMMGGEDSIIDALTGSVDIFTVAMIIFACVFFASSVVKKK